MDKHLPLQLKQAQNSCEGHFYCLAWEAFCFEYSLLTKKNNFPQLVLEMDFQEHTLSSLSVTVLSSFMPNKKYFLNETNSTYHCALENNSEKMCLWFICEERTSCVLGKNTFSSKHLSFVVHYFSQSKTKYPPIYLKDVHSILYFLELWRLHQVSLFHHIERTLYMTKFSNQDHFFLFGTSNRVCSCFTCVQDILQIDWRSLPLCFLYCNSIWFITLLEGSFRPFETDINTSYLLL